MSINIMGYHRLISSFARMHNMSIAGKSKEEREKMDKPFSLGTNGYHVNSPLFIWKIAQTPFNELSIEQKRALGEYVLVMEKKLQRQAKLYEQRMAKLEQLLSTFDTPSDLYDKDEDYGQ
jgi:hypothetical protein